MEDRAGSTGHALPRCALCTDGAGWNTGHQMRLTLQSLFVLGLVGCAHHTGDDMPGDDMPGNAQLVVTIDSAQLGWIDGVAETSPVHAFRIAADGTRTEVTDQASFSVSPAQLGSIASATLAPSGQLAGPGQVTAQLDSLFAAGDFTVRVTETLPGTADASVPALFGSATLDPAAGPIQIAYPPASALVPPNLGDMDVHWRDTTKDVYEVQLASKFVTLREYVNKLGNATWLTVASDRWTQLSQGTGGADLEVRVRGISTTAPATFAEGKETVRIAAEDVKGGVYYWNTSRAAIMRFDMTMPTVAPEQFYPQVGQTGCVGCHAVSRDGTVVAYRQEGDNMNYGNSLDVATLTRQLPVNTQRWNFAAIHPDNSEMFTTTDTGLYRTDLATHATTPLYTTTRISHPDVAASGDQIVATQVTGGSEVWTSSGKIVVFDYDKVAKTVGAPRTLSAPTGTAFQYYPSFSPDNAWVLYNQATGGNSYNNAGAELWVAKADGSAAPIRLTEAEVAGSYDSWPKWTPFVTTEGSEPVIWFTVASQRPFGVRSVGAQKPQLWLAPFYPERAAQGLPASGPALRLSFQSLTEGNHIAQWTQAIVEIQ